MIDPGTAESRILAELPTLPAEDCPLREAAGRILRTPVRADRPLPPFDRVTMDGYAVRAAAVAGGLRRLRIVGRQAAGQIPLRLRAEDEAVEIATGAVLPTGADAVIPYEFIASPDSAAGVLELPSDLTIAAGLNIHAQGSDHAAGEIVLPSGLRLDGATIAVAAAVGAAHVTVSSRPTVAVIATGDELVDVSTREIAPHHIRRSNDHALAAALRLSGLAGKVEQYHLRDVREEIEPTLATVLAQSDVVLLTGGVSKGKYDFIPAALQKLGVMEKIRGVAQRPGKPFWFGVSVRRLPVFALPGNPVSAYTCFRRFVIPALRHLAGAPALPPECAVLAEPVTFKPPLAYLLPVTVRSDGSGRRVAQPNPFNTSGDLAGLVGSSGFVELPAHDSDFPAGSVVPYYAWP